MGGEREYGFAGAGVVAADGNSRFLAPDTDRLRLPPDQLAAVLRRRLTAWGIMHRYSNLTGRRGERRRAVVIYGPTSSGKTALSLDVCEAASGRGLRPVVLNADSRQVYVGMDIGTSKIKPSQMRGFEHRLLDVAEPSSKLSLEAYAQMVRDELASLAGSENAVPVLVGGTGVYVQAVLEGWDLTGTGTLRRSLERDFPRGDVTGSYQVLARLAPEVARRVHPGNYEAILNALVRRMAGHAGNEAAMPFAFAVYGVDRGEAETDRRIETTLDAQIRDGLLAEIAELDRRYRLVEQARRPGHRRMGIASSSAWPRRPGRQSRSSTARTLPPPGPKRSVTSGRTPSGSGRGSANLARRGSTIDQR
jgi:tRNA dimethylallyltransferase